MPEPDFMSESPTQKRDSKTHALSHHNHGAPTPPSRHHRSLPRQAAPRPPPPSHLLLPRPPPRGHPRHLCPPPLAFFKSLIRCYASHGLFASSLSTFVDMVTSGNRPDHVFPSVLRGCACLVDLRVVEGLHGLVIWIGFEGDLYTGNALMNMYGKLWGGCFGVLAADGRNLDACRLFDEIPQSNINLNSMGRFDGLGGVRELNRVHGKKYVVNKPSINDISSGSGDGIFDAGSCLDPVLDRGRVDENVNWMEPVRKVFESMPVKDVVTWNTLIVGNAQNGMYEEALVMLREMGLSGMKPDSFTLSSIMPILEEYVDIQKGKEIHGYAIRQGFDTDVLVGSSLIDMYANCTRVGDSQAIFNLLSQQMLFLGIH